MQNNLNNSSSFHQEYQTTDTALAAYLVIEGYKLLRTDNSNPKSVVFYFKTDGAEFDEAVNQFELGTAQGNIVNFYHTHRRLVQRVKENPRKYKPI